MGYTFKEPKREDELTELRKARVRYYLPDLANAYALENGAYVHHILDVDQHYVHVSGHKWRDPCIRDDGEQWRRSPTKEQGVIIVHATTKGGSLIATDRYDPAYFLKYEG